MHPLFAYLRPSLSFCGAAGAYVMGIALVVLVTAGGAYRLGAAMLAEPAEQARSEARVASESRRKPAAASVEALRAPDATVVRQGSMTPTQGVWERPYSQRPGAYRRSYGPQFGSSARGMGRPRGFFDSLFGWDGWDRPETYRTLCVRLCDGFYFPISFSAPPERFEHDRRACESSCGAQGRLFVYRNPGGELEDMQDLQGRPYRQLRTAFLYRTEYVADCKCRPHPWEQQAKDQHRIYALAAAKRKGDKAAAAELAALEARMREASSQRPAKTAGLSGSVSDYNGRSGVPAGAGRWLSEGEGDADRMRLGRKSRGQEGAWRPRDGRAGDWSRRSFWRDF